MAKRLLRIVLTVVLLVSVTSVGVYEAYAEERVATKVVLGTSDGTGIELNADTPVYVNGEACAKEISGDGTFSAFLDVADATSPVLYLNGLQVDGYYADPYQDGFSYGVYIDGKITVNMSGVSSVENTAAQNQTAFGVCVADEVSFVSETEGELIIVADGSNGCYGVEAAGINMSSGRVTAVAESGGVSCYGVRSSENITVTGGLVNGDLTGSTDGTVQGRQSYGIVNSTGSISVEGGELVAKGGPTKEKKGLSHGIYYGTALDISGGRVLAESNTEAVGGYSFVTMEGGLPTLSAMHYRLRLQNGDELLYVNDGREFVAWYSPFTEIICGEYDGEALPTPGPTTKPSADVTSEPTDGPTEGPSICPTPNIAEVKKVKFVKKNVKLKKGRAVTLKVKLTPAKGLTKADKKVKWSINKKGKKM